MRATPDPAGLHDAAAKDTARVGDKLLTMREIRAKFRIGRTAGYELVRRPGFPARIVVSPRCHRWKENEVDAFADELRPGSRRAPATRRSQPPGSRRSSCSPTLSWAIFWFERSGRTLACGFVDRGR
jgi:predicted DNA-binding transcriptional regulator AlpA